MSASIAQQRTCACGCGQAVSGRRYLNARHKQRTAPPPPKAYPHYVSATTRLQKCSHGTILMEVLFGGSPIAQDWYMVERCPDCRREERDRLESLKPKPTSACAARTCKCPAPKCQYCGQPMTMGPGSLGFHSWSCCDIAQVEDKEAQTGIIAKPFVLTGSHRTEKLTPWREHATN